MRRPTRRELVFGYGLGAAVGVAIFLFVPHEYAPSGPWLIIVPLVGLTVMLIVQWLWGKEIGRWFRG